MVKRETRSTVVSRVASDAEHFKQIVVNAHAHTTTSWLRKHIADALLVDVAEVVLRICGKLYWDNSTSGEIDIDGTLECKVVSPLDPIRVMVALTKHECFGVVTLSGAAHSLNDLATTTQSYRNAPQQLFVVGVPQHTTLRDGSFTEMSDEDPDGVDNPEKTWQ